MHIEIVQHITLYHPRMCLEFAIVIRCFIVGIKCQDYMRRVVCFGAGSALMFQLMINTGMCIGVMPVIGLTLPFISYGGTSILTTYAMLGLANARTFLL